jgi:fluoroquinolone transport system ATP-binding protein
MIDVRELRHSYTRGGKPAVDGVSFEVAQSEVFGFLGPNGAGKSTTQKILTGLLPVQEGEVKVAGRDIRRPTGELFNLIGVSFETPNVYLKLTGFENLRFFASLYDGPTVDPVELLRKVGLEEAANRRAATYSKGMRQRLVLARSMINRPKLWFLDEPTTGLDPTATQWVLDLVREQRDRGATVFLTTHNMFVADALCDRVAFLNEGRIAALDTPRSLKLGYGERVVAVEYRGGEGGDGGQLHRETLSMTSEGERRRLEELVTAGRLETVHSQEATLEEVFIKVTGRGLA